MWYNNFLSEISMNFWKPIPLNIDSMGAQAIAKNHVVSKHTKQIQIKYYATREQINVFKTITLNRVRSTDNIADGFTKIFTADKHKDFTDKLKLFYKR